MNDKGIALESYTNIINSLPLLREQSISLSDENKNKFADMYANLNNYSSSKDKGTKLEDLIFFIIDNTLIFEGYQNIRSSTNEVDIFIKLSDLGNMMLANNIIDLKSSQIIIECKNYDKKKIDVTWVGKFCSLLLQGSARVGILISHKGFKGYKWDSAKGLAKKFYYYKERIDEKKYVLDITLNEIVKSVNSDNFVELVLNKIVALENDTKYENFITKHPNEESLDKLS